MRQYLGNSFRPLAANAPVSWAGSAGVLRPLPGKGWIVPLISASRIDDASENFPEAFGVDGVNSRDIIFSRVS